MFMVYSFLSPPNFIPPLPIKPKTNPNTYSHPCHPNNPIHHSNNKRECPILPKVASIPYPPINVDYLEREYSEHGVSFADLSGSCVVKMGLDNGSSATLMLPSGLITSYKPHMWHGGTLELLHTTVSEADQRGGPAVIEGGVSLVFKCEGGDGGGSWSPSSWAIHDVKGASQDMVQVELISRNTENMVEFKHIVSLTEDVLSSELVVTNSNSSSLSLMGSIMSHLTVSTPEATYAVGLEGSNFFSRPPFSSNFSIIPPEISQKKDMSLGKQWGLTALMEFWSNGGARKESNADDAEVRKMETETEIEEEMEGEEDDNYKHLTEKMSRIYTSAPRYFTIIDRGRRNSVIMGRDGFDELYMFSPGSDHEWYDRYAYICVGQSALREPIILNPEGVWRGCQHIHNPNL